MFICPFKESLFGQFPPDESAGHDMARRSSSACGPVQADRPQAMMGSNGGKHQGCISGEQYSKCH